MIKILALKHEKIFDFLAKLYQKNKSFLFVPRKINNKKRLDDGYWFIGNDNYLQVSFWDGTDWKEKIHNISFVVMADDSSYIEISSQDSKEKAQFLRLLVEKLGGFKQYGKKNKWYREYSSKDYLSNLEDFLSKDKPIIDKMIKEHKPDGISFLADNFYSQYVEPIIMLRKGQKDPGISKKVARISWNTEGWKFPSGPLGKSSDPNSYEAKHGYGHEEWLFDRSRIIDGFHYAFLEPLMVESGKHFGKIYNISLFTINGNRKKFYVGDIKKAICIPKEEAENAYQIYKKNGWIQEMTDEIRRVGSNPDVFLKNLPKYIFNVKFKFEDVNELDELEEISKEDLNITTNRFKLLPKKNGFLINEIAIDDEPEGDFRNETRRKIVIKKEIEYDPYHNKMQNVLKRILQESYKDEYDKVCIEKGRIDIKARTKSKKWHYFEIKTNTPKISIRNALGQIMEYAYWPNLEKAEKLIIVGHSPLDDDAACYMGYVRDKFHIPVYYRSLDINKRSLSKDF